MDIQVILHKDRSLPGTLTVSTNHFFCACLGQSDYTAAVQNGNPTRDPLKRFGNIPTGTYKVSMLAAAASTPADLRSYGPNKRLWIDPVSGLAYVAKQAGRSSLLVHGGAPSPTGGFRPTHGCIRLTNADMAMLIQIVAGATTPVTLTVLEV